MALLHTPEILEEIQAPDFQLRGVDGKTHTLESCMGPKGLVAFFICNHCPYVKAVIDRLVHDAAALKDIGVGCVAIMPNDTENYPEDSFENMRKFAEKHKFGFPYLIDDTQNVARAYGAVCTPDIFGFDKDGWLKYRGRLDSAANKPADKTTRRELLEAMIEIAGSGDFSGRQFPSMGCSIKWR